MLSGGAGGVGRATQRQGGGRNEIGRQLGVELTRGVSAEDGESLFDVAGVGAREFGEEHLGDLDLARSHASSAQLAEAYREQFVERLPNPDREVDCRFVGRRAQGGWQRRRWMLASPL